MRLAIAITAAATAAVAGADGLGSRAHACPPLAALRGDDELVREIDDLLRARGVDSPSATHRVAARPGGAGAFDRARARLADEDAASCPVVRARVEARDGAIAVEVVGPDGARSERVVNEAATAATVIESFVRADVGAPLLARRALPGSPANEAPEVAERAPARQRDLTTRGVQLFAAIESSMGSDHTGWMGTQLGVCISLGPICAAARLRSSNVVGGDGIWADGAIERESTDLLVGIDLPLAFGRKTLSPGFAAGLGAIRTGAAGMLENGARADGSAGLRADVHTTLTVPIRHRLALDLSVSVDVSQATHVEWRSEMQMPAEPFALVRLGAGLRYGGM